MGLKRNKYILIVLFIIFIIIIACVTALAILCFEQSHSKEKVETPVTNPTYRINKDSIKIYEEGIFIPGDFNIAYFSDTGSMKPFMGNNSVGIQIDVTNSTKLQIGDIVSYKTNESRICHRIIDINYDELGVYYTTKGDNSEYSDELKVRRDMIVKLLVGIIY